MAQEAQNAILWREWARLTRRLEADQGNFNHGWTRMDSDGADDEV